MILLPFFQLMLGFDYITFVFLGGFLVSFLLKLGGVIR